MQVWKKTIERVSKTKIIGQTETQLCIRSKGFPNFHWACCEAFCISLFNKAYRLWFLWLSYKDSLFSLPNFWNSTCLCNAWRGAYIAWGPAAAVKTDPWQWLTAAASPCGQIGLQSHTRRCRPELQSAHAENSWSRSVASRYAGYAWSSTGFLCQWSWGTTRRTFLLESKLNDNILH